MKSHLLIASVFWIAHLPVKAQLAGKFEPFSYQSNAKSWVVYDYADGKLYKPSWDSADDGLNPDIFFTFAGANALDFYADNLTSGGAFVGNLAAGGVDAIGCDIFVEDSSSFNYGEFFLFSTATNKYYVSDFIDPASSGWDFAYASLTQEDWYVLNNGSYVPIRLTPQILGSVREIGITFRPLSTPNPNGKVVGIDNFTFYGSLALPQLTTSAAGDSFKLDFQRRPGVAYSILSSPNLNAWTLVPGQGNITGTTPYTMTRPLTPDPRFFKVGIVDYLTPVPQVIP